MARVSIIVPTLNEAKALGRTLRCLRVLEPQPAEIIVVDGGSTDGTVQQIQALVEERVADQPPLTLLTSQVPGRSRQLNLGARHASGDILCFLHADTRVPDDLVTVLEKTLADTGTACGGFISLMTGSLTTRWSVSLHNTLKTHYAPLLFRPHLYWGRGLRLLFGDQVMFCRRDDFWSVGGFDDTMPIMEEADLCLKLCRLGRIRQVNRVVQSSDRRVAQWGVWKANVIYLMIGFLWGIGVSAQTLKRFYEEVR